MLTDTCDNDLHIDKSQHHSNKYGYPQMVIGGVLLYSNLDDHHSITRGRRTGVFKFDKLFITRPI